MSGSKQQPRRVSMAYVLGFSDKPFKETKPLPLPQPPRRSALTEPGGFFEWAASDGRKGKLTGRGRPRLTAANVAKVPSDKQTAKAASKKSASKKEIEKAVEDVGGLMGLFDDTPAVGEEKKTDTSAAFTGEQDKKLMEMKNSDNTWAEISKELGKDTDECKERFKQIKPADWKPKEKTSSKNKDQNKGGNKGNQGKQTQKKEDKKDEDTKKSDSGNDNTGNTTNNDNKDNNGNKDNENPMGNYDMWGGMASGNPVDNTELNADSGNGEDAKKTGEDAWKETSDDPWKKDDNEIKEWDYSNDENAWNKPGEGADSWPAVDSGANAENIGGNDGTKDTANDWDSTPAWGVPSSDNKAPSKSGSKAPSKCGSKAASKKSSIKPQSAKGPTGASTAEPLMYEITPDDTFSADDLRMIARILQQDAKMVWNRVSWRFRDKTGRNLDPDVFEEKITGQIERKGSEK